MTDSALPDSALPEPAATDSERLRAAAASVLLGNWAGGSTVPSRTLYPHQWSWDSAFIAIGLRHLSPRRARRELETLFSAQWRSDGRVPHIVFNDSVPADAYFPGPDFWQVGVPGEAGLTGTSGIVQPPVHALAAWEVHRTDPGASHGVGFLHRLYPRLVQWHDYLRVHRDLGGHGLASIVHPWESGWDNSPCWDTPLARITPADPASYVRRDLAHSDAADRPTDLDYGRYVRLCTDYREADYDDTLTEHTFAVEDPCFNALLTVSEYALADIATAIGADPAPHRERAAQLTSALIDHLYDAEAGIFRCRDLRTEASGSASGGASGGGLIDELSASGLVPLVIPGLPDHIVSALLRTAAGDRFGLGRVHLLPSYDLLGPAFDPARYWRGPSWFNIAWLFHRGLRQYGAEADAKQLREGLLDAAGRSGFAEYVDPHTGEGRGIRSFSWTAATTLDLIGDTA